MMVPKVRLNEAENLLEKELRAVVRDWQAEGHMLGRKVRRWVDERESERKRWERRREKSGGNSGERRERCGGRISDALEVEWWWDELREW